MDGSSKMNGFLWVENISNGAVKYLIADLKGQGNPWTVVLPISTV